MKDMTKTLLIAGVVMAAATAARADSLQISSVGGISTENVGAFTGVVSFQANGFTGAADLSIELTNTSDAANGGYITGFVFNINDDPDGSIVATYTDSDAAGTGFDNLTDPVAGSPFGEFEAGSGLGGVFLGGGSPTGGMAPGQIRTFFFELSDNSENMPGLSASTFLSALSTGGNQSAVLAVRFRGFENGDSDKVVAGQVVPLPAAAWGGLMLIGGLGAARFRARKHAR